MRQPFEPERTVRAAHLLEMKGAGRSAPRVRAPESRVERSASRDGLSHGRSGGLAVRRLQTLTRSRCIAEPRHPCILFTVAVHVYRRHHGRPHTAPAPGSALHPGCSLGERHAAYARGDRRGARFQVRECHGGTSARPAAQRVLELLPGASRGIQLRDSLREQLGLPLIGRVAAGKPILAEENIEELATRWIRSSFSRGRITCSRSAG